jgi:prepilin-type N-terminal cleavage/methylation domain-containing protein
MQFFAKKSKKKGFTLIELLVVIAIIGLLATIVVVSVNSARVKARNNSIIKSLNGLREAGEMYNTSSYAGFCVNNDCTSGSSDWKRICNGVKKQNDGGAVTCSIQAVNATSWCASVLLVNTANQYYCVDSANRAKIQAAACSGQACL